MKAIFTRQRFEGERVIQTAPEMGNRITEEWYSRPILYTGRALTADTLICNTRHHIRHLQLFGRQLSRGIIHGLELTNYTRSYIDENDSEQAEQWLRLTAGIGITYGGDDVALPETTDIYLEHVFQPDSEDPPRGAGIFVLQPIEIIDEIAPDPDNQCQWDKERDPLDDEQIIDGCRLVFLPWPKEILGQAPPVQAKHFRNQLAYQVFDYELQNADQLPPWELVGVPLGLAYITNNGKILFIDQQAVARQGGAPLTTKVFLNNNGTPFLWEARIQQFIGHLYDISQHVDELPSAFSHFEVLPPVGVLPRHALNFDDMSTEFFPSQFIVDAVPIPEEQLEVAMNASACLRPFDLYQPEKIKLLVPVPQAVYEPDLLKREVPDPIFLETLRKLIREIRQWLANRDYLRDMAPRVIGAIDYGRIPVFEEDMDAIPDEKTFMVPIVRYEGIIKFGRQATDAVGNLFSWIKDNTTVSDNDIVQLLILKTNPPRFHGSFTGLENFVLDLQKKIKQTEDYLNSGFVKAETDMYRLRQLLLGNIKASRLATSPAMGQIVGGRKTMPSVEDVEFYFNTAIATKKTEAAAEAPGITGRQLTPIMMTPSDMIGKTEGEKIDSASAIIKKKEPGKTIKTEELMFAASTLASIAAERLGDANKAMSMLAQPDKAASGKDDLYYAQPAPAPVMFDYKEPWVTAQKQGVTRDKSIVERIYESPAMEVKSNTVQTKATVFDSLAKVPLDIDEKVSIAGSDTAILSRSDYDAILNGLQEAIEKEVLGNRSRLSDDFASVLVIPLTDEEKAALSSAQVTPANLEAILSTLAVNLEKNKMSFKDVKLGKSIREGVFDPDPTDGDEANFFASGLTALEHGMEAMRAVDRRLDDYKKALKQCNKVLTDLRVNAKRWHDALNEADDKLTVLRHDALVTRSLFDEERARITAINEQRRAILENYVSTLVFVRPRVVDSRLDTPSIKLYGEYINPVPACLAEDFEATGELEDMLDVFREVPLNWLTNARSLVQLIKYPAKMVDIMKQATRRTYKLSSSSATMQSPAYQTLNKNEYGKAVSSIVNAHQQYKQTFFEQKSAMDFAQLNAKTWLDLVQEAETNLSLADLIEAGKGNSALAHKATLVMENIEDVAVCLYYRCNELKPAIKLQWANLISVYDKPVDLRHLEILPAWEKIDFVFRRDLQNMVDWLFSQVETDIPQARQTMNDLVRVCILLAGHAPVSTIIQGYVDEPSTGKVGDVIDIAINKGLVKVGMVATVFTDKAIAVQGVVKDVGEKAVRVMVTQAKDGAQDYSVDKGSQVKFHTGKALTALL